MQKVWIKPLFRDGAFKPQWQHGLVRGKPGTIKQFERWHPLFGRLVMLSWFKPLDGEEKVYPLIDAHRVDMSAEYFQLWGIVRADGWTDKFYPQAWDVFLYDVSAAARRQQVVQDALDAAKGDSVP